MTEFKSKIRTIEWVDNVSRMVDQTLFPYEFKFVDIKTGQEMFDAIRTMIVRGAPAIGIAGAHGVVLYAQELQKENLSREEFVSKLIEKAEYLKKHGMVDMIINRKELKEKLICLLNLLTNTFEKGE